MTRTHLCTVCGHPDPQPVLHIPRVPVLCNQTWPDATAAKAAATAPMDLRFCEQCGHLFNASFDGQRVTYGPHYENSLHGSGRFRAYAAELAAELATRYGLQGKRVVEIGCGQGDFLRLLCRDDANQGVGFDPSYAGAHEGRTEEGVTIHRRPFRAASLADLAPDLVCCRHLLEHLEDPVGFLCEVRRACERPGGIPVFFEVPNALWTLRDGGVWDVLYEHCGYFTPASLRHAFVMAGFDVRAVEPTYGGQFLTIHATAPAPSVRGARGERPVRVRDEPLSVAALRQHAQSYATRFRATVGEWGDQLRRLGAEGAAVAVWGAGSKGITFANLVPEASETVSCLVDINPRKQGKHIPGTGHPIVAPSDLCAHPPGAVIAMNPLYVDEIGSALADMGLDPELLSVH